jgi:hypothetical protein
MEFDSEKFKLKGFVKIDHIRDGQIIDTREFANLIVNVGKAQIAGLINGVVTTPFKYVAIGTGTTAPAAGDTALAGETHRASATTIDRVTTTVTNDTARWVHTFSFTASYALAESGLFDASTAGNLLARQTFATINVASGDSLQVTWKVQAS